MSGPGAPFTPTRLPVSAQAEDTSATSPNKSKTSKKKTTPLSKDLMTFLEKNQADQRQVIVELEKQR